MTKINLKESLETSVVEIKKYVDGKYKTLIQNIDAEDSVARARIEELNNTLKTKETITGSQEKANLAKEGAISTSKEYTDKKVADLVGSAPETLNTLQELADAIEGNQAGVTDLLAKVGAKADKTYVDTGFAKKTELHNHTNKTVLDGITSTKVTEWDNKSTFSGNYNDLTNKPSIPIKLSQLTNDSGYLTSIPSEYITETELDSKGYLTNVNFSLGVHSDGKIYLFVNGEPVGMGVFISNAEISTSDGYITDDNIIMLSDNIPSGTYTMKYENEDGSYSLIGDFTI